MLTNLFYIFLIGYNQNYYKHALIKVDRVLLHVSVTILD